jgi:hypothetical protein
MGLYAQAVTEDARIAQGKVVDRRGKTSRIRRLQINVPYCA